MSDLTRPGEQIDKGWGLKRSRGLSRGPASKTTQAGEATAPCQSREAGLHASLSVCKDQSGWPSLGCDEMQSDRQQIDDLTRPIEQASSQMDGGRDREKLEPWSSACPFTMTIEEATTQAPANRVLQVRGAARC